MIFATELMGWEPHLAEQAVDDLLGRLPGDESTDTQTAWTEFARRFASTISRSVRPSHLPNQPEISALLQLTPAARLYVLLRLLGGLEPEKVASLIPSDESTDDREEITWSQLNAVLANTTLNSPEEFADHTLETASTWRIANTRAKAGQQPKAALTPGKMLLHPAGIAAVASALIIAAMLIFEMSERLGRYSAHPLVENLVALSGQSHTERFPSASADGRGLADWLLVHHDLNGLEVPAAYQSQPVLGARILDVKGVAVVQVLVETNRVIYYLFDPRADGLELPASEEPWTYVRAGDWHGALIKHGEIGFLLTAHGSRQRLESLIQNSP